MPTVFVPFANLSFAGGRLNSAGLVACDGVVPDGIGYLPLPPLFLACGNIDDAGADASLRGFASVNPNPNIVNGGAHAIYLYYNGKIQAIDIPVTGAATPPWDAFELGSMTIPPHEGGMLGYGPNLIVVGGHGEMAKIRLQNTTELEDLFTTVSKPKCKFVASIGAKALYGNMADTGYAGAPDPNHDLIWWSKLNDVRMVSTPTNLPEGGSSYQPLPDDYGEISALGSGRRRAYIFKRRACYTLDIGGPLEYTTDRVSSDIGALTQRSIVQLGDQVFFWSWAGPAVIRDGRVSLLSDGFSMVRGLETDSPPLSEFEVLSAASDPRMGLVLWLLRYVAHDVEYALGDDGMPVESLSQPATTRYAILGYNLLTQQMSFVARGGPNGFSISDGETSSDYLPIALVDRVQWGNTLPLTGVGLWAAEENGAPKLFMFGVTGSTYAPAYALDQDVLFSTGLIPIGNERHVIVQRVRPIYRRRRGYGTPSMTVIIRTTNGPFDVERRSADFSSMDRSGWISTKGSAHGGFHGFDLVIPHADGDGYAFNITELEGLEVYYEAAQGR